MFSRDIVIPQEYNKLIYWCANVNHSKCFKLLVFCTHDNEKVYVTLYGCKVTWFYGYMGVMLHRYNITWV